MKVDIFTICDFATAEPTTGKLNVLGAFTHVNASKTPIVHPTCAIAMKLRFERIEEGQKTIRLSFVDADGKPVMPTLDLKTHVKVPPAESIATVPVVIVMQQLRLPNFGDYSIDLAVDGRQEASIPLVVRQAVQETNTPPPQK